MPTLLSVNRPPTGTVAVRFPARSVHALVFSMPRHSCRSGSARVRGSPSKISDDTALRRMKKHGVTLSSTNQVIAELAGNWATPEGSQIVQVVMEALQGA